jgi:hypothetical protein
VQEDLTSFFIVLVVNQSLRDGRDLGRNKEYTPKETNNLALIPTSATYQICHLCRLLNFPTAQLPLHEMEVAIFSYQGLSKIMQLGATPFI